MRQKIIKGKLFEFVLYLLLANRFVLVTGTLCCGVTYFQGVRTA